MKSFKKISLLTVACTLLVGLSFSNSFAQVNKNQMSDTTYAVQGKVVDASDSSAVLADAQISIEGTDIQTTSAEDGTFMLENLPLGEHTLIVKLEGYETWTKDMNLTEDTTLTIELTPEQ